MSIRASIPAEILLEIFEQSLPPRLDQDGRLAFQVIRCVCSTWRTISLSSPTLWASISVKCEKRSRDYHQDCITRLDRWFSRAGLHIPLELDFSDPGISRMADKANAVTKALIVRHQARWRYLSLYINTHDFWDVICTPLPSYWVNLHCLSIWTYDMMYMEAEGQQGLDTLADITSLRRLVVNHMDYYQHTRRIGPINLPELDIFLDSFSIHEANLISAYSNLSKLSLVSSEHCYYESSPDYSLALPLLASFSFDTYDLFLLDILMVPSLIELNIVEHHETHQPHAPLTAFIKRCTNQLETFTLSGGSKGIVAECLPSLLNQPRITHLAVDKWPSLLEIELAEITGKDWCPILRDLTVLSSRDNLDDEQGINSLAVFLTRRQGLGLPSLERLTIHRGSEAAPFPYESFADIKLRELRVLVPL
jgi:F-box-like